mmetsp:Transcript_15483/g.24506  ORF Transcript_15483/g.24506 Transcript_15483/m.24506 type:complete len:88 (+) Transcript_15483:1622-1885(+)
MPLCGLPNRLISMSKVKLSGMFYSTDVMCSLRGSSGWNVATEKFLNIMLIIRHAYCTESSTCLIRKHWSCDLVSFDGRVISTANFVY